MFSFSYISSVQLCKNNKNNFSHSFFFRKSKIFLNFFKYQYL